MSSAPPRSRIAGVTGVLLAGGRARRLGGVPKGLLRVEGETIASRSVRLFAEIFDDVLLAANDASPYAALGVRTVPDVFVGRGAPGGVHAALSAATTPWAFIAGCDMPHLSSDGVRLLADRRTTGCRVVCACWDGAPQPLHALWSRDALPLLERALRSGSPSLRALAREVGAAEVSSEDWARIDPCGRAFANANTPADLARLGLDRPAPARGPAEGLR